MALPPAQFVQVNATTTDVQVLTGMFLLRGYTINETTGLATAACHFDDGESTSAPRVVTISLASGGMWSDWFGESGVLLRSGLYLDVTAGSIRTCIYYTPLTHLDDIDLVTGSNGPYLFRPGT